MILALVWLVAGNVAAMFPSSRSHWPSAYGLMALGLPLLVWLWQVDGWFWALMFLIAAGSVLRWTVRYAWRWVKRMTGRTT